MSDSEETWKGVPGWPNYQASSLGRVKGPIRILKPYPRPDGYLHVQLCTPGKVDTRFLLHRLICLTFHGPPPFEKAMALHKNHDRADCREDNLYWGSRQDNADDMTNAGRQARNRTRAKLTSEDVLEIRRLHSEEGIMAERLAETYSLAACTISNILRRKTWSNI